MVDPCKSILNAYESLDFHRA